MPLGAAAYNGAMATADDRDALTCVLADDHAAVRAAVRAQLECLRWVRVVAEAEDGVVALEQIARLRPDVAVVDVRMPQVDGFELCAHVRARNPGTRVILYSALDGPENARLSVEVGAVAFVSKHDGFRPLKRVLEQLRHT